MDQRRTDTREQLHSVALDLFAEQGYDGTSLREIAERLGVTKAAVYYHFRTKEDILASLIDGFLDQIEELVQWGSRQVPSGAVRAELLHKYSDLLSTRIVKLIQVAQAVQSAVEDPALACKIDTAFHRLIELLAESDDSPSARLRARVALAALHLGAQPGDDNCDNGDNDGGAGAEQQAVALAIATEVLAQPLSR